jgi:hypothetical protein
MSSRDFDSYPDFTFALDVKFENYHISNARE